MDNKIYTETEKQEAEWLEKQEIEALKKMKEESVRKFKEKFPNGATIAEAEFLE